MNIRYAQERDIPRLEELLVQVCNVHHAGRPDLFRAGGQKYDRRQLLDLLGDGNRPVLVAADGEDRAVGYAFCVLQVHRGERVCPDMTTLYLDDLCVDQACRGQRVGSGLYQAVLALARERGCYNVTLNVWACNQTAMDFYRRCGLQVQKTGMEVIL